MCREHLAARGIFRACESGFGMQAPYVTRLIRNTGENFLNLSGSFLNVCGAAVVRGCYTTAPLPFPRRPGSPSRGLRRCGQIVLPGSGAVGKEPAVGSGGLGKGVTLGSHKLCNARLSFLYGCEKRGVGSWED